MDYEDSVGSGGSTPVQDEHEYMGSPPPSPGSPSTPQGSDFEGEEPMEVDSQPSRGQTGLGMGDANDDDDYVSDGGEVEREDVERAEDDNEDSEGGEAIEREEVEREVEEYSPARPPHSPLGSSPPWSGPGSPAGSGSPPASPPGSSPASPADSNASGSPGRGRPRSPPSDSENRSVRSGSASPAGSARSRSGSPAGSGRSRSGSPAGSDRSRSGSRSPGGSPARSRSGSPAGSARSRSGSPAGSARSRSGSPAGSDRSRSGSPAGSARSRSGSPAGSARSRSGSPAGSARSRSGSPAGSARSRSGSPAGSARSRSGSPAGSQRSRSGSPAGSMRSRSRSRSGSRSRSRGGSASPARSRSGSPAGSVHSSRSGSRSPAGSRHSSGSPSPNRRRRVIDSDKENDSDEEEEKSKATSDKEDEAETSRAKKAKDSDDEDKSDKESDVDINLIADIFGSSDEEEEFEGFRESDMTPAKKKEKTKATIKSDDEDDDEGNEAAAANEGEKGVLPELSEDEIEDDNAKGARGEDFVSDFDLMMQRKKEEQSRKRRKRKDFDMINDNDDLIADLIRQMKEAAEEDRTLNEHRQAATKKLKLLPFVVSQLKKSALGEVFLESGILSAITEWLAPLPDKSLPHLSIRESMLRILMQFQGIGSDMLKNSGIGKAVMYLYKHPRELKENRERAGKLINEWSRPIFNLTSNYKNLSREEREQRDYEQLPKKRRISLEGGETPRRDIDKALAGEEKTLRPGDPGWVYRARVPNPSNKDYVVRPKSAIEVQAKINAKKQLSRYDKRARAIAEKRKFQKNQRAVTISIEGRNMAL